MELRHLRYFAAVVEAGGFSRAAARLRMTQPALGRQIRDLERELNVRLFDRVGRRVQLTAPGDDLLRRCRAILTDTEALVERGRALASGTTGVLRVGATPQSIETVLGPFVPRFRRAHPGVELQVVEDGGPRLLGALDRGEIHLALTAAGDDRFASRALFPAVAMAVMLKRHPLARRRTVDVTALAGVPLLLLRRDFGIRQWFDSACQSRHVRPQLALESAAPQAIIALAAAGHGIGVLPSTVRVTDPELRLAPVTAGDDVIGGWLNASWDRRRFLPAFGHAFVDELAKAWRRGFPGQAVVRRAPRLPAHRPLPIELPR